MCIFLCAVPQVSAQIRHHMREIPALLYPTVDTIHYKGMAQRMNGRSMGRVIAIWCHFPKIMKPSRACLKNKYCTNQIKVRK